MPIFTAAATALFAGTALAGTFAVGATAFGLQVATGLALSYAAQALSGKPAQQQQAASRVAGVQGTLQAGGDIPRSFPLGYSVTAGSLVYANFWGNDGETPNAFFTQVIAVADLPTTLNAVYVNGELVTLLTGEAHADRGYPVSEYRKEGKDHLWIKFRDGTQTTADPFLSNYVASADRPWGPDRVGAGIPHATCTALVNDELFSGFPQFRFALNGVKLYDISKDSTAGGSGPHRWSDPSTWGGDGDNFPAVQAYNVLRGVTFGGNWLYGLQGIAGARLPAAAWINAIAACRDPIVGVSGSEPMYRAGHECRVGVQIADTLEVLMTACQAKLSEIGGVYKMRVGEPGAPVATFTDADIISTEEQTFTPFFGLAETITGIAATYPEPAEGWATKEAPPRHDADLEALTGGRRLLADVKFDAVPYPEQVQRLMKSALLEAQRARRHTYVLPPMFWAVEPGDVIEWSSNRNGYTSKLFRIEGAVDKANLDILVDLTEVDPSDYDWEHNVDYSPVTNSPIAFVRPGGQAIRDWFAAGDIVYDEDGLPRRPAIRLEWDGTVVDDIAAVQFEVRNDFDAKVVHRGRTEIVSAGSILISQNLLPNASYEARGRYVPANLRETLWSDWLSVTTPDVRLGVEDVRDSIKYNLVQLQDYMQAQIDDLKAKLKAAGNQDARNWIDKKEIRGQLSAQIGTAYAVINQVQTVAVNTQQAFASFASSTNTRIGNVESSVTTVQESVADISGWAASQYAVRLDTNGHVVEFGLFNGGPGTGTATFRIDKFELYLNGIGNKAPFVFGTINGAATFGVAGNMILDGSIKAWHITAGSINSGHIRSGSIGTDQLAVGGVDIHNLIAGAATKVTSHDGGTVAMTAAGTLFYLVSSGAINFPVACSTVVMASMIGNGGSPTSRVASGLPYPSEAQSITFGIYVDDALVPGSLRTFTYLNTFSGGYVFPMPGYFDMVVIGETVIPAGAHIVTIKGYYTRFDVGLTDPSSPVTVSSSKMIVTQNRR